jgi:N-acetyl-anhydromuramyl-L-alanine amidase AmpD
LTETEAQPDPPEKTAAEEVKEPDASRGFLMVDGQKVNVPFPVAHTLFNFTQAMVTAKDHREACGRKGKSRRRQADCDHGRWFGLLDNKEAGKPFYLEPRGSERVRQIILHATMTRNVPDAIRLMVGHAVSTHVMIDSDGTVYQVADLALTAHHMTNHNETSIGVDLVSPMPNLTNWNPRKDYELAPEPHLEKLTLRRPIATFQLRGRTIRSRGPTSAQQTSLTAVCKALVRTFPTIKRKVPRDGAGKVMFDTLENPTHFSGILGHFHTSPTRWDPGPGIDWDALEKAIQ